MPIRTRRRWWTVVSRGVVALLAGAAALAATAPSASATFSGTDGRIAFVRANQIYTIPASGGTAVRLTSSGKNYRPEWSPDGTRIAYINEPTAGVRDLWVMQAGGSAKTKVTSVGSVIAGPSWSPDGTRLAFSDATRRLLWTRAVAPFGTPTAFLGFTTGDAWSDPEDPSVRHELFLTRHVLGDSARLAWSQDDRIAFAGEYDGHLDVSLQTYFVATGENRIVDATGGDCCGYDRWSELFWGPSGQLGRTVARSDNLDPWMPSYVSYPGLTMQTMNGDTAGAPAPSSRRIAVSNASSGVSQIFVENLDGTGRRLLTAGYQPDWQSR